MTTSSPRLTSTLILKLDKCSLEEIESYISDRKLEALYSTLNTLAPDDIAYALNRLNKAYLDGDFDRHYTKDNSDD
jgi:hypothetical protein